MRCFIGILFVLFGLLTVAMICPTTAQTADVSPGTVSRPSPRPFLIVDPSDPPPTHPSFNSPPSVGRYQAVSDSGRLLLIDTATAECWSLSGSRWVQHAQPINRANAAPAADSAPSNKALDGADGQPKKSPLAATVTLQVKAAQPQVFPSKNANVDWNEFEAYKHNLEAAIKAPAIVAFALNDKIVADLPIIKRHGADAADWLANAIEVEFPGNAEWMSVTIDVGDKDQSLKLASAVVNAFMHEIVNVADFQRRQRRQNLESQLNMLKQKQLDRRRQLDELSRQIGTSDSVSSRLKKKIAEDELENLLRQRSEIQKKINDITFQLKLAEVLTMNAETNAIPDDAIEAALSKNQRLQDATANLAKLHAEQQEIEKAVIDKEKYPAATRIRDAIDATRKQIEEIKGQVRDQVVDRLKKQGAATGAADIQRLRIQRELMLTQLKETASQIDAQAENIQKLEKFNGDVFQLRADIDQTQGIVKEMADALTRLNIEMSAEPRVRVVGMPY